MAWDHLAINKPHLVYIILGGFTSLFMLCSSVIKERMYIGEATVATLCGLIFGPHAANLINPMTWGNTDQITLEFSRIVLVVQCFAVGVELPKYYMEKHWRSVVFLLIPVMTFGWLVTSLFIWWMVPQLSWLESLCVAACVTATDPVLASSVVGKGKFAKRVPRHLRDLLSAESGCNDGMAFPFIYLALYLIEYNSKAGETSFHWIVITVLYECIFGGFYGFMIGYIGRHGIKFAEKHDLVDRESFLVFYFVLALFCAGSGSIIGVDDLLVGFAAGVGFSNDGWFTQKTEESHVSNVIDLLLNLAYFVYLGTIIPWEQYNSVSLGLTPWRLVVIAIFVILFRRIPIMMALKPLIPDIKTWREALFAGHFGPIGVGAIFVAILARAELETGGATPLASGPTEGSENYLLVSLIWPIVTFLVIASIVVHGSSVAVFTLGKHINTLTLTMSYTTAHEEGPSWMNRLPRISSQSRSQAKTERSDTDVDISYPPGTLPPIGLPGQFLRRQKEEDTPSRVNSRSSSRIPRRRRKKWDDGLGPGGPISESAIRPQPRTFSEPTSTTLTPESSDSQEIERSESDEEKREELQPRSDAERHPEKFEAYEEGDDLIVEDEDGEVVTVARSPDHGSDRQRIEETLDDVKKELDNPGQAYNKLMKRLGTWGKKKEGEAAPKMPQPKQQDPERKHQAALLYQFGNTIIVEDEDGEVVKKYELPTQEKKAGSSRLGNWALGKKVDEEEGGEKGKTVGDLQDEEDDRRIRFTIGGIGRRMTKEDFLREVSKLDPKSRSEAIASSNAPAGVKEDLATASSSHRPGPNIQSGSAATRRQSEQVTPQIPTIEVSRHSSRSTENEGETAAERRRRQGALGSSNDSDSPESDSDGDEGGEMETPAERRRRQAALGLGPSVLRSSRDSRGDTETPAEKRRREAALGMAGQAEAEEDSDDDDTPRVPQQRSRGIRFAEDPVRGKK